MHGFTLNRSQSARCLGGFRESDMGSQMCDSRPRPQVCRVNPVPVIKAQDPQRRTVTVDLKGPTRGTDRPALKTIGWEYREERES